MSTLSPIVTKTTPTKVLDSLRVMKNAYKRWSYKNQEFREYGLYRDDMYRDGHPDVYEAVRRLPEELRDGRDHRLHRALQLSKSKIVLPEPLWTRENDKNHNYLKPYLDEVLAEKAEKAEWNKK